MLTWNECLGHGLHLVFRVPRPSVLSFSFFFSFSLSHTRTPCRCPPVYIFLFLSPTLIYCYFLGWERREKNCMYSNKSSKYHERHCFLTLLEKKGLPLKHILDFASGFTTALSRLKAKKKLWCVLDENKCQVVYHKSEDDARCKPPLGSIELRGAAITLDLDNQNQFVIMWVFNLIGR